MLLAAGASRRLGLCKALVPLGGRSPLERLLEAGRGLGSSVPPLVITGAHHGDIQRAVRRRVERAEGPGNQAAAEPQVLENVGWREGRTGSVRLAHEARPGLALCLAPVDVPTVPRGVFERLARAWDQGGRPARGWLAPFVEDPGPGPAGSDPRRFGHPVIVGPRLLRELEAFGPDAPLRWLRDRAAPRFGIPVPGREVLEDLDTPADLERISRALEAREG